MNRETVKKQIRQMGIRLLGIAKWAVFSLVTGSVLGAIGAVFYHGIVWAGTFRAAHG